VRTFILALAFCALPLAAWADTPDNDTAATRLAAAQRYAKVADMPKMMRESVQQMAQRIPEAERQDFVDFMNGAVRVDVLESGTVVLMTKHFTTDELNAMADFYGSAVGKSILQKFSVYMADAMTLIQAEFMHAFEMQQQARQGKKS
jgi:uncharacterized protein